MTLSEIGLIIVSVASIIGSVLLVRLYYGRTSRQIVDSRNPVEQLVSQISDIGVLAIDRSELILFGNSFVEAMFGYRQNEMIGSRLRKILLPVNQDHPGNRKHGYFLNYDAGVNISMLQGKTKDGRLIQVAVSTGRIPAAADDDVTVLFIIEQNGEALSKPDTAGDQPESIVSTRTPDTVPRLPDEENGTGKFPGTKPIQSDADSQPDERRSIEDQLVYDQNLYSAIARHFPNGLIAVLDLKLRFIMIDGREIGILGVSGGELVGRSIFDGSEPLLDEAARSHLENVLAGRGTTFEINRGSSVYSIIAVPLYDQRDAIYAILLVMQNITKVKHLEQSLYNAIEQEKKLNDLKLRFVTMASHEFRTPLSTILSSLFFLESYDGASYEENKHVHINRIKRTVNMLTETLNDFLRLGKLEEGRVEIVLSEMDVREYAADTIRELQPVCKPRQKILFAHEGLDRPILLDKYILRGILNNLLSNALKYSAEGGEINLKTAVSSDQVRIDVIDHGIGIPPKEQERIFERFFRALNASDIEGTGLGLHIVKKYVELLNGTIGFSSTTKGTTFTVTIPLKLTPGNTSLILNQDR